MEWRLIDSGTTSAFCNMAIDEAIFCCFPTVRQPTLRFYQWSPPALSIGYFQPMAQINARICQKRGYGLVRRPTGGRAVLHNSELTYSFVHSIDGMPGTISKSYRNISQALVLGLKKLGLLAELSRVKDKGNTPACFDSPARFEIKIGGKKVIGSAQTRRKEALLQQGSIPLRVDVDELLSLLKIEGENTKRKTREVLKNKAAGLEDFAGERIEITDLKCAIKSGFSNWYDVKLLDSSLTRKELELAHKLTEEKYSTDEWNFRR